MESGFSLIAWIATLPFMLVGGRFFYLMVLYSRMQTEIAIDRARFQVHTRGLKADELLEGSSAHLKVVGPAGINRDPRFWPQRPSGSRAALRNWRSVMACRSTSSARCSAS